MSPGLIPFMTARLNEEYATADMLDVQGTWHVGKSEPGIVRSEFLHVAARCSEEELSSAELRAEHVARYDPARAKREIAAKRARLALLDWAVTEMGRLLADDDAEKTGQGAAIGCYKAARSGVEHDAAVYSDHPDYLREWNR